MDDNVVLVELIPFTGMTKIQELSFILKETIIGDIISCRLKYWKIQTEPRLKLSHSIDAVF